MRSLLPLLPGHDSSVGSILGLLRGGVTAQGYPARCSQAGAARKGRRIGETVGD
jgi:hypothetical protein